MARTKITSRQLHAQNQATAAILKAKLDEHDVALDAVCDATGNEHLTSAGAINPLVWLTTLAISGTMVFTLAAGIKVGQRKTIRCKSAASTPAGSVTGTFVDGVTAATTLAFNAAEDTVQLVWNGTAWAVALAISVSIS